VNNTKTKTDEQKSLKSGRKVSEVSRSVDGEGRSNHCEKDLCKRGIAYAYTLEASNGDAKDWWTLTAMTVIGANKHVTDKMETTPTVTVGTSVIECMCTWICYLGSLITKGNDCSVEISRGINLASRRLGMKTWASKPRSSHVCSPVYSTLLLKHRLWLLTFEMRCYRRILKVCRKDNYQQKCQRKSSERQCTVMDLIRQN